jgi:hypothetical protein
MDATGWSYAALDSMANRGLYLGCLPVGASNGVTRISSPSIISPSASDALVNVDVLLGVYGAFYPGLNSYQLPVELQLHLEQLYLELLDVRSLAAEYLAISRFSASVRCRHTFAKFYNQSSSVLRTLLKQLHTVPFFFLRSHGRMVLTREFTPDHRLPRGSEIVAIDSVPTATILTQLMTVARAGESNDGKHVALMHVQGLDRYESFDILYPLLFPPKHYRYVLTIRRPDSPRLEQIAVSSETDAQRLNQ